MLVRTEHQAPARIAEIAVTIFALTGFRFWAAAHIGLVPDETYYWLWSRVPSAGYFDHPPMIAWWIWLSTRLLGNSAIGVRAIPVLSVLVTTSAVYGTVLELELDRRLASVAALWLNAMFLIGGAAIIATPDAPSIMFWALTVWVLARLRRTEKPWLWIAVGVFAGLGCVSKYTNLFLGVGIVGWMLVDQKARRWMYTIWPFIGGVAALCCFMPVILWNADHHWVSFAKQFGRIEDNRITLRYVGDFLASQFGLINPVIAIFAVIQILRMWKGSGVHARSPLVFLLALSSPLALYMLFHATHDRVQGNWPGPLYPAIAIIAAAAATAPGNSRRLDRLSRIAAPAGIGLIGLFMLNFGLPFGVVLPLRSPVDRIEGWQEFSDTIGALQKNNGAKWIATVGYGLTGELAFHSRNPDLVHEVIDRDRYSFEKPDQQLASEPALLVMREGGPAGRDLAGCFQSFEPVAQLTRKAGTRIIRGYDVYKVSGAPADLFLNGCHDPQRPAG